MRNTYEHMTTATAQCRTHARTHDANVLGHACYLVSLVGIQDKRAYRFVSISLRQHAFVCIEIVRNMSVCVCVCRFVLPADLCKFMKVCVFFSLQYVLLSAEQQLPCHGIAPHITTKYTLFKA